MNDQTIYWLWLQQAIGYASRKLEMITARYTFAEDFYRAPMSDKYLVGGFTSREYECLCAASLDDAARTIEICRTLGIDIVSYPDEAYPPQLREIPTPPAVLFVKGSLSALKPGLGIGIVGTRSATLSGKKAAFRIAYDLAKKNVCVVSGGAIGIDTQAHIGALHAGGVTVCVLGCGHAAGYLPENEDMRRSVAVRGAVISEYPPYYRPSRLTFPQRNRIISGLSRGILVVEAGQRSGALITVSMAAEQGRDVFAVPGDIGSYCALGTNALIKDGAKPVTCAEDILCEYKGIQEKECSGEKNAKADRMGFKEYIGVSSVQRAPAKKSPSAKPKAPAENKVKKTQEMRPCAAESKPAGNGKKEKEKKAPPPKKKELPNDLSEEAALFYGALLEGEAHIDAVAEKTGLSVSAVHAAATELEMNDLIEALPGRRYRAIES